MWEEVQEQLKQKKVRTEELKVRLTQSEAETTEQVRPSLTTSLSFHKRAWWSPTG